MSETQPMKVVVDCSQVGALAPAAAEALAAQLREAALLAIENDNLERAATMMQDAKDVLAVGVATVQLVELDPDDLDALDAHRAEQSALAAAAQAARLADIVARCDRLLAQTDWIMAPAAARPVDMSARLVKACEKHAPEWAAWRAQVRDIRAAAAAGTADPDDPGFPVQPASPEIALG